MEHINEIEVLNQEISPVFKLAQGLIIEDEEGMGIATELLSKLNQFGDRMKEEREKVTKPLNEALEAERARWRPIDETNKTAISIVRGKMSLYQTEQVEKQRKEEARIAARVGEGKGKLKVETAVKKIENLKQVDNKVSSSSGSVKFREDKILKITDETKIPREYLIVDEKMVLSALKAGLVVMGAELEIKMVPINFR